MTSPPREMVLIMCDRMMNESPKVSAIILAGGLGNRFHGKKQFETIAGMQMWELPYKKACRLLGPENVTVVGVDIPGGKTRTGSVINGLMAVDSNTDRILIIEAARPLVTEEQLIQLAEANHPSTTFVRPLVNTVTYRDGRYLNRNELYELLTPQAFDYKLLKEALTSGQFYDVTDETRIMFEYHGIRPLFIETEASLMKVTYPEDIHVVRYLIERAQE